MVCEAHDDLNMAMQMALRALQVKIHVHGRDFSDVKDYSGVVQRIKGKMEAESL